MSTFPLRAILHKLELSGQLMKWAVELGEFNIKYQNRTTLKSQVLADSVAEMTPEATATLDKECSIGECILHVNWSSNVKGSYVGVYLKTLTGEIIEQSFHLGFKASNNEAEYEAMIADLWLAKSISTKRLLMMSDS